jgi:hypothetical protein
MKKFLLIAVLCGCPAAKPVPPKPAAEPSMVSQPSHEGGLTVPDP